MHPRQIRKQSPEACTFGGLVHYLANARCRLVETAIHGAAVANLQHLRRFIKPEHLPTCLRRPEETPQLTEYAVEPSLSSGLQGHNQDGVSSAYQSAKISVGPAKASQQPVLHYLVCPASAINVEDLRTIFQSAGPSLGVSIVPNLRLIQVPLYPPCSEKQANEWSQEYWPIVYRGGSPFGPHPSLVSRSLEDLRSRVEICMRLAKRAGEEVSLAGQGEPIGAVIVDHSRGEGGSVVAIAGDARWRHIDKAKGLGSGNVTAHAIMRAIGIVAMKRRAILRNGQASHCDSGELDVDADRPLTTLEKEVYAASTVARGGYLCLDLELYITHEPCVMCSMAILHSRFSRVIFGQRMLRTGGLTAILQNDSGLNTDNGDQGLGYGLFWRPELNWRHLAWQWIADDEEQTLVSSQDIHV